MKFRVIDIETTGMMPPAAEIVEIGYTDVLLQENGIAVIAKAPSAKLFKPVNDIPVETMAVHHITPKMVEDCSVCHPNILIDLCKSTDVIVAHNAEFEGRWFTPSIRNEKPLLCTFKSALRVWPEAPAHSNSVLKYWLNLDLIDHVAMPPHRAGPDSYVTAHILIKLLKERTPEEMIDWTKQFKQITVLPFGKHKGKTWDKVPADYLDWLVNKSEMDDDVKWNAKKEIERRSKPSVTSLQS